MRPIRILFLSFAWLGLLCLSPSVRTVEAQEAAEEITIGVAYLTQEPDYLFEGIRYPSFWQSYQKQWQRLAVEHGFDLEEIVGGLLLDTQVTALNHLVNFGADAVMLYTYGPVTVEASGEGVLSRELPIAYHSPLLPEDILHPFIGYHEQEDARELGRQVARLFRERLPDQTPGLMMVTSALSELYRKRVQGFQEGVREELPEAVLLEVVETSGSADDAMRQVSAALVQNPQVNLFFGATDSMAQGIMAALRSLGRGDGGTEVVAAAGGTEAAMAELVNPDSAWKGQIGLAIRESTETAYRLLMDLLRGEPLGAAAGSVIRIHSPVFVEPSLAEVRSYLLLNHAVEEFDPDRAVTR